MKHLEKIKRFCEEYELGMPIVMASMAGACPPAQAWAGQAASLAKKFDAGKLVKNIWAEVEEKLG